MALSTEQLNALIAESAKTTDHTKTQETVRELPRAGTHVARLVDVIELGSHIGMYQGKPKAKPSPEIRLGFELLSNGDINEYTNEDGSKVRRAERLSVTMPLSLNSKAKFKKLFTRMANHSPNVTIMAQMLGQAFLVDVVHTTSPANGKVYANLVLESFKPAVMVDAMNPSEPPKPLPVPPAVGDLRVFLWGYPTIETWDSLYIDGVRTNTDPVTGIETKVSNNWIQEKIRRAMNFPGSLTEIMLLNSGKDLPDITTPDAEAEFEGIIDESDDPTGATEQGATQSETDAALAAIGLK